MANPSPEAVQAIRTRVVGLGLDWEAVTDGQVLDALRADTVPNTDPQPDVTADFQATDFLAVFEGDAAHAERLIHSPAFVGPIVALLDAPNPKTAAQLRQIGGWAQALLLAEDVSPAQYQAITAILSATRPDPAYRETLPRIETALGRPLDADDVAAARPGT